MSHDRSKIASGTQSLTLLTDTRARLDLAASRRALNGPDERSAARRKPTFGSRGRAHEIGLAEASDDAARCDEQQRRPRRRSFPHLHHAMRCSGSTAGARRATCGGHSRSTNNGTSERGSRTTRHRYRGGLDRAERRDERVCPRREPPPLGPKARAVR